MSDQNPYQSPTAEPPSPPSRPLVWLNVLRALAYNMLILMLLLLACYISATEGDFWQTGVTVLLLFLTIRSKLRPKEAKHPMHPVEWAIFFLGVVVGGLYAHRWVNRFHTETYLAFFFCWTYSFNAVRDSLYGAGVLPRGVD
jgi:hypothetical protein